MRPSGFTRMDFSAPARPADPLGLEEQGESDLQKGRDSENAASIDKDAGVEKEVPVGSTVEPV